MSFSYLTAPALHDKPGIRHAFFTRQGGVSTGIYASLNGGIGSQDAPEAVADNRAHMESVLGVETGHLLTAYQIHSADVITATAPWGADNRPRADAIVTATRGLAVSVTVADCGPVLFADEEAGVVGAAHAGWKGAVGGVLEATLIAMENIGARRNRITAVLGPCIRQASYEVGPEFVSNLTAHSPGGEQFFIPSINKGHALFDLAGYIRMRLEEAGTGAVDDLDLNTYTDEERFFSYRRTTHRGEPDYGRMVAGIVLLP